MWYKTSVFLEAEVRLYFIPKEFHSLRSTLPLLPILLKRWFELYGVEARQRLSHRSRVRTHRPKPGDSNQTASLCASGWCSRWDRSRGSLIDLQDPSATPTPESTRKRYLKKYNSKPWGKTARYLCLKTSGMLCFYNFI